MSLKTSTLILIVALMPLAPDDRPCRQWAPAVRIGELPRQIRESSGIAVSRDYPNRLYHINDSGDAGMFYVSEMDGSKIRPVRIDSFRPRDAEALSIGPCPGRTRRSCLYIADIGDNGRRRRSIEIAIVEELREFGATVSTLARMTLRSRRRS